MTHFHFKEKEVDIRTIASKLILFGLGMIFENKRDNLISINFGGNFWIDINPSLRLFSQFRFQESASLEPGGGDTVTSLMLGIGLQIPIN